MLFGGEEGGKLGVERRKVQFREWFLLDGNRGVVAGGITGILFVLVTFVSASGIAPLQDTQPLFYVFSGLLGGNLTIITVVVSINQLLISRELTTPDKLRSQIEGTIEYRNHVEDVSGRTAPVEPLGFLRLLYENTRTTAQQLGGLTFSEMTSDVSMAVDAENADGVTEELESVVTNVTENVDRVDNLLQNSDASTFTVLSTTLGTNYARDIYRLRQLRAQHGDRLPDEVRDATETLIHQLQDIDIARQYFKGVYLQQELASLSRLLFYVGIPALFVVVSTLLAFTASSTAIVPRPYLDLLVSVTITVGLLPLITLFAYILRTATVARRTAAKIPFTAPTQEQ
ncbi:hypothetical protein [Halobacterium zhouii]|uniref:hypothetical protein n=1 Tax=Halobacterium zhouii TaxID=2902624 RepID=UPI001E58E9B1|nr:hypothetical protein [Halobacterium zhouii]